ncbi:MAG: hypothetical protein JOZ29_21795 [Deltaproteobacteria bacterium]|nr:hypothetical protein [Deltaproteobacteria bacterium]
MKVRSLRQKNTVSPGDDPDEIIHRHQTAVRVAANKMVGGALLESRSE